MRQPGATEPRSPSDPPPGSGGTQPAALRHTLTSPSGGAAGGAPAEAGALPAIPGFELRDEVGRGGMGVVYRARDLTLDREVAVKILQEMYAPDSATAARFVEEARITAQLQHPGIPAVYQVGTLAGGRPFLAMKLIKGRTLDALVKAKAPIDALAVFEAISQAVGYAHAHDVIHRDLKPSNVMVGAFGEVQVMDWGLAKVLAGPGQPKAETSADPEATTAPTQIRSARESDGHFTQAGSVLGTPAYMAPEQAAGEVDKIGTRADVFGLGAILCVLLTGRPPFEGQGPEGVRLNAVRGRTDQALARMADCGADTDVVALCKRCLAFEPADRPPTANEVAAAVAGLRRAADERVKQAERDRLAAEVRAAEQAKRRRWVQRAAVAVAAVLLLGVGGTTAGLMWADAARRAAEAAERETELKRQEADSARHETEVKREEAEAARQAEAELRRNAEETLYLNRITLADRECRVSNFRHAEGLLALCPPARRRWEWFYLQWLCHGELRTVDAGGVTVNDARYSPDGKYVVYSTGQPYQSDSPGEIVFCDATTLEVVKRLRGHLGAVYGVHFQPDGTHLLSTARFTDLGRMIRNRAELTEATRGEVRVWNFQAGRTVLQMPGYTALTGSPDGKYLAGAALNGDVRVWEAKTRQVLLHLPHRWGIVTGLGYSPDGRWLTARWQDLRVAELSRGEVELGAGSRTGTIVFDAHSGVEHMILDGDSAATFSPDGKRLGVARDDNTARIWDLETKTEVAVFRGHTHLVNDLSFSPDGRRLVTASLDRTVCLWDVDGGRLVRTLSGHNDMVVSAAFSPDGRAVLTGSWDGTVKVWSADDDPASRTLRGHTSFVANVAFSPGGRLLASAGPEAVRLWAVDGGQELFRLEGTLQCAAFRHDGNVLATGGDNGSVGLWDVSGAAGGQKPTRLRELTGHTGRLNSVAFRPDGRQLASSSTGSPDGRQPGEVYLWDADTGRRVGQLSGPKTSVLSLAWRPGGQQLATLAGDGTLQVWEPATGTEVRSLRPAPPFGSAYLAVGTVAYSHDGKLLAAAAANAIDVRQRPGIVMWDAETGEERVRMGGHSAPVSGLAFSPDDRRLASASWDINRGAIGEVKLWDVRTGTEILTLPGHVAVAFSPDGRFLAGVGGDVLGACVVKVWDGGRR
jgi:WD40 repeat protein/serine/threonine protein kinase